MKVRRACQQCRSGKKRCYRPDAGDACSRCLQARLQCSYLHKPGRQRQLQPSVNHSLTRSISPPGICLSQEITEELVEHYLHYIHDRPHSLFHRPTLRHQVATNSLNQSVLHAICSYGSRFHKNPEIRSLGPQLSAEAKRLLRGDIENVCLETIQACTLVGNLSSSELNSTSEAIYCGLATRLAIILGINSCDHSDSVILNEVKLRVWWTLYMSDRWCSTRLGLPRMIGDFDMTRDLPMDEYTFHNLGGNSTERKPGLWAHMITLVRTFGPIQDLNQRLAKEDSPDGDLDKCVEELSQKLDSWEQLLPTDIKMTQANLEAHRRKGLGGPFIALHLGYHHYSTLLYFQFLDSQNRPYAERCKAHAVGSSSLLRTARELENCEAVYATVGQMAMVSSAVLLHTLLFGNEDELSEARSSLSSNFETLIELKRYWPYNLGKTIERLFLFQRICFVLANAHSTHKIDRWMVRFLLEHSLPLHDKLPAIGGFPTPTEFAALSTEDQRFSERGRMTDNVLSQLLG